MGSETPKVLIPVEGRPLLGYVLDSVRGAGVDRILVVVGQGREEVMAEFNDQGLEFAVQAEQKGTADAVLSCRELMAGDDECVVVYGDVPMMRAQTIRRLVDARAKRGADVTVLTARFEDPFGYGRIVRGRGDVIEDIVEERDADDAVRRIREVNSGFYAFGWGRLLPVLERIEPSPVSGEYYLTDAVKGVRAEGGLVVAVRMADPVEMMGANTPEQLEQVARELVRRAVSR
jgi:bifunctional UDP-N-acetylglucosamine pyrophosphorylase/glucosamine-1-phosphate N-acetyltransferase